MSKQSQLEKKRAYRLAYQRSEKYKQWRREHRKKIGNMDSKRYGKTINGFLMRAYMNMKARVTGVQKQKAHLYLGKDLLSKEEFYNFSRNDKAFLKLFKEWTMTGYDTRLSPSVNRIDSNKGYTLDNIEWITHSANSSLSSITKKLKKQEMTMIYNIAGVYNKKGYNV